ncbi:lysostaphin resistance A-like protein [Chloroflexota bacterium]
MSPKNIFISILLTFGGFVIFVFGNPYYSVLPTNGNQRYYIAITLIFLTISVIFKFKRSLSVYQPAVYSLFVAAAALLFLDTGILNLHNSSMPPLLNLALDKFSQFIHVVPVILVLTFLVGGDRKSIFLSAGELKRGLTFGLVSFGIFALVAFLMGVQSSGFFSSFWDALPLLLVFIFSNAIMEELWFRGLFLKNYQTLVGRKAAILVTAIVFGASHINAAYQFPGDGFVFGFVVFLLGVIGAYAMLMDDSLIGPVLFHAGYDLLVIVPVLNTL